MEKGLTPGGEELHWRDNQETEYMGPSDWWTITVPSELQQTKFNFLLVKAILLSVPDLIFFL